MTVARIILTTVGTAEDAEKVARDLVEQRVAACVNILPGVRSFYRWKGAIADEQEILLYIKTAASRVDDVFERLEAIHPYELPEFMVIAPDTVGADYAEWIEENTWPVASQDT